MKLLIDENNVVIAWQIVGNGWSDTENTTVEVDDIPEEVKENPIKYCYIKGEFVENLNYKPPEQPIGETDNTILDLAEMAIDHEMRLSMLELGLTE